MRGQDQVGWPLFLTPSLYQPLASSCFSVRSMKVIVVPQVVKPRGFSRATNLHGESLNLTRL